MTNDADDAQHQRLMDYPATTATVETLPNGLTLILDPDPTAPVISAQVWVETGSIHEDRHLGAGLSHFLEHMVFKGTRDYDADALANTVQAAGGHWNAYTTFERTVYYIDGPAASLPEFLKCLSGLVFFPTLPESDFAMEMDVIRREIDMGLDDPDNIATRLMLSTAFQLDPRRHPVIGHRHRFDAINYADLTRYHRDRYTTDRCFITIAGDFDPDATRNLVAQLTADCQPGCGREPHIANDPPQLGPRYARETFAIPSSRISLTWHSPPIHHPQAPAYEILATILGRGNSSRLYQRLREQDHLALEIAAFNWSFPHHNGLFGISADAQPEHREATIAAVLAEIEDLPKKHTDRLVSELAKAQRQIAASQFRSLTSVSGRASDLASNWHEARDLDFTRRYLHALQRVGPDEVLAAAANLTNDLLSTTILDPMDAPAPVRAGKSKRQQGEITVENLPNGLQLALIPDHRVPLLHLQVAVRAGLPAETAATQGISQLLASSMPKGTSKRSAADVALALESLGASLSAATGNNALLVQAAGLAPDFSAICEILSEVTLEPSLPDAAIGRERASQLSALQESMQQPLHVGLRALRDACYQSTGYGLDPLGSIESLPQLDRNALAAHHRKHFNAANLSIAISGDFDPAEARDKIAAHFDALPTGDVWTPPASHFQPGTEITRHLPKKQAVLAIGFEGGTASSDDRHALAFIQEYASDMAGPLFMRLREELGLAYQVGATQFLGYDSGLFTFYIATSPEQVELARTELLNEINKIATHGIPSDAFERVRATVLSGVALSQQSLSATARHCALDLLFGHPADSHRMLPTIYQKLNPGHVADVAKRLLSAAPSIATVMPEAE